MSFQENTFNGPQYLHIIIFMIDHLTGCAQSLDDEAAEWNPSIVPENQS